MEYSNPIRLTNVLVAADVVADTNDDDDDDDDD